MKKKMIFAAAAVIMATAVSAFAYIGSERNATEGLFSANVEALARSESGLGRMCVPNAVLGTEYYILCSTCKPGHITAYSFSFCNLR